MMLEAKDPAIRLFGRTIQLAQDDDVSGHPRSAESVTAVVVVVDCEHSSDISSYGSVSHQSFSDKSPADEGGSVDLKPEHGSSSSVLDQTKSSSEDKESSSAKASEKEEEEEEEEEGGTSGSQDTNNKPLKKPTKILPCPRCNSTETKFCYFNNYNVNQPRHFCKKCQRYWTAGGTMRSMVIGAGRRKNKNSCLNSHPFVIPNAIPDSSFESQKPDNVSFQSYATLWPNPAFAVPVYAVPPFWYSPAALRPDSQLGKHPRDGNQLDISNEEEKRAEITKVLVPKTLRFDDPSEAAKSSIWTTLGIKNEKIRSVDSGAFFGGFESKGGDMNSAKLSTSRLLQANPAALSRSFAFHECA